MQLYPVTNYPMFSKINPFYMHNVKETHCSTKEEPRRTVKRKKNFSTTLLLPFVTMLVLHYSCHPAKRVCVCLSSICLRSCAFLKCFYQPVELALLREAVIRTHAYNDVTGYANVEFGS